MDDAFLYDTMRKLFAVLPLTVLALGFVDHDRRVVGARPDMDARQRPARARSALRALTSSCSAARRCWSRCS